MGEITGGGKGKDAILPLQINAHMKTQTLADKSALLWTHQDVVK